MADWWDEFLDVAGGIVKVVGPIAGSIAGAAITADANDRAVSEVIKGTQAQADQLQLGEDERLVAKIAGIRFAEDAIAKRLDAVTKIYQDANARFGGDIKAAAADYARRLPEMATHVADLITGQAAAYGDALRTAAARAGVDLSAAAEVFGSKVTGAGQEFDNTLRQAASTFTQQRMEGPDALRGEIGTWADAGRETVPLLRRIALSDPSRLTDSQRIMVEDFERQSAQGLATSGLRGSAGGIAAIARERARMLAAAHDTNRARGDRALDTLGSRGYDAAGRIGQSTEAAIADSARVGYAAADKGASAIQQAQMLAAQAAQRAREQAVTLGLNAEQEAERAYLQTYTAQLGRIYDAGREGQGQVLAGAREVARTGMDTSGRVATATGDYWTGRAGLAGTEADAVGSAAYNKREAEARALGPVAALTGQGIIANADTFGKTIGTISRQFASEQAEGYRPPVYSDSPKGGMGDDTLRYYDSYGGNQGIAP